MSVPDTPPRVGSVQSRLLSIIIPVYNEESTVAEVIRRVASVELPMSKEIIVVDDGSTDGTARALRELGGVITKLHSSSSNLGKGAAVRHGLSLVSGSIVLIQDADLELNPDEYASLLGPILEGKTSVVYGSRFLNAGNRIRVSRRLANWVLTKIANILYRTDLTDMETAYKVFRSDVARQLTLRSTGFEFEPEITARIARAGFQITEVPVSYSPRTRSEGKKIRWRDGLKAIYVLIKCRLSG